MHEISPAEQLQRRRNRVMFVVFGALALAFALYPTVCSYVDQPQGYWARYADVPQAGAGALPALVPASATEIHTRRDDRSGLRWVRYTVPRAEHDRVVAGLRRLSKHEATALHVDAPAFTPWWTVNERTMLGRAGNRLEVYALPQGGAWLFVDPSSSIGFYWSRAQARRD
jgi:hypothetical protein